MANHAVVGMAQARPAGSLGSVRLFVPSARFYSWYPGSFGYYGFYGDDLFVDASYPYGPYGYGGFGLSPYGPGYGRFGYYDPYAPYASYAFGGMAYQAGGDDRYDRNRDRQTGSIRLRANPSDAKVYIDGALVGAVDDFNGLMTHLDIDAGTHQLELRAPGYESYATSVSVVAGKTMTTRANLKKKK